jgi:DNA polymerase beta
MSVNEQLADLFKQVSKQYANTDEWRANAYNKASIAIRQYSEKITSGDQAKKNIRGVGKSVAIKIDEYLQTGTLAILSSGPAPISPVENEKARIIGLFTGIYGVGERTAEKWYNDGYHDLLSLQHVPKTDAQTWGYYFYHHLQERIPRAEGQQIEQRLQFELTQIDTDLVWQICGSYRRGAADSGDIDQLIRANNDISLDSIVVRLTLSGFIVAPLAMGKTKFLGICRLSENTIARRIDIMIVDEYKWSYATLYFTGSQKLNVLMRERAIEKGWLLNEYGLYDQNQNRIDARTEQDIFELLEMEYLKPTERSLE